MTVIETNQVLLATTVSVCIASVFS